MLTERIEPVNWIQAGYNRLLRPVLPRQWALVDDDPETVAKMPRTLEADRRRDCPPLDEEVSWPVPDGDRLAEMTEQRDGTAD